MKNTEQDCYFFIKSKYMHGEKLMTNLSLITKYVKSNCEKYKGLHVNFRLPHK